MVRSGGDIDPHADLWAIGVLLYEMVSGAQPFVAPDTRRLEQRIQSRRPPALVGGACSSGLQAVMSKLLAGAVADRYGNAEAIRVDLERLTNQCQTQAEHEGWPKPAAVIDDEPPTRRSKRPDSADEEATRRTVPPPPADPARSQGAPPPVTGRVASAATPAASNKRRLRTVRTVLLLLALGLVLNEYAVGVRAARIARDVPTRELDGLAGVWDEYDNLRARSSFHVAVLGLERALVRQSSALADRVIANYRSPLPTVRETQWKMAREALAHAASVAPGDSRVRATLRYCDGHIHRINGEARKARKRTAEAQQEFTEAVAAFREAAELRQNWPDPFLGLMRTFIYGLEDVDRGADALQQAQRLGYTAGDRETVQLADGYRSRGDSFAQTARSLADMPQEQEYLTRAADAYRQAVDRYSKAIGYADVPRSLRQAQRGLAQVERRVAELSGARRPPASAIPRVVIPWL